MGQSQLNWRAMAVISKGDRIHSFLFKKNISALNYSICFRFTLFPFGSSMGSASSFYLFILKVRAKNIRSKKYILRICCLLVLIVIILASSFSFCTSSSSNTLRQSKAKIILIRVTVGNHNAN